MEQDGIILSCLEEFTFKSNIVKDVKRVLTIHEDILRSQGTFWIASKQLSDEAQRERIKTALERHCRTPVKWNIIQTEHSTNYELEITIDPDKKCPGSHSST